ncbi:glycoside hydrolase family protein [Flavivirga aquimarina]|uniref:Glycoside hydrolase family protein n=1 Tax=Flavivirga aquimarina TaxID=2027862 RepID=A0ABT8W5F8_9FLAO|nr:glycoside hydrolase family protein [Flavivirga aquimarina]MDO5968345.1 glycoside hydrolase family protein [Flavivirga aquimarina]
MKFKILVLLGIVVFFSSCKKDLSIKESAFSKSHVPGDYILDAPENWWQWCMAPIYDTSNKLHVFMSAIPNDGSWTKDSKIVHYTAKSPEGPYTFVDTIFASKTHTYHNPQVSQVNNTYVLVYLLKNRETPGINQEIGIATSKSLDGPWTESPHNPIIKASGKQGDGANIVHASNPTFVKDKDGKFRIYYKSITDAYGSERHREISLALSDNIEGPYENYSENPLISYADKGLDIEDCYAFLYKDSYYMIVEDRKGIKEMLEGKIRDDGLIKPGGWRPGLIYKSEDGINWGRPEIGYKTNEQYFGDKLARTERPHILWKNGEPEYLFLACHDEDPSAGFFVKIDGWIPN